MKNGTLYAKRIKKLQSQLRKEHGPVEVDSAKSDPLEELVVGVFSTECNRTKAIKAAKALQEIMVDINEVRVSTPDEIAVVVSSHIPKAHKVSEHLLSALEAIYRKEHGVTLEHLPKLGRRDAKQYLETVAKLNPNAVASIMQWSLGAHAVPLTVPMFETLRADDLVEPSADIAEVQAFLERNIAATDAREFCLLMEQYAANHKPKAAAKKSAAKPTAKKKSTSKAKTADKKAPARTKKRARKR